MQVVPAAHCFVVPPLQPTEHATSPPQKIEQSALPLQSMVQPPLGQSTMQALLPVQDTVDPVSTSTSHPLPPPQVTVLLVPVEMVQLLLPSHVLMQFETHVMAHVDWPAQLVVQPVPHEVVQSFFESQLEVTLFGGLGAGRTIPPSALAVAPPKVHVPPALQVHVTSVQLQSPEHTWLRSPQRCRCRRTTQGTKPRNATDEMERLFMPTIEQEAVRHDRVYFTLRRRGARG